MIQTMKAFAATLEIPLDMGNETLAFRSSGCAPPFLSDKDFAHDQVDSHVPFPSSGLMVNVYGC